MRLKDKVKLLDELYKNIDKLDQMLEKVYSGDMFDCWDEESAGIIISNALAWAATLIYGCVRKCGTEVKASPVETDNCTFFFEQAMGMQGDDFAGILSSLGVEVSCIGPNSENIKKAMFPELVNASWSERNNICTLRWKHIQDKMDIYAPLKTVSAEEVVSLYLTDLEYRDCSDKEIELAKKALAENVEELKKIAPDICISEAIGYCGTIEEDSQDDEYGELNSTSTVVHLTDKERHRFLREKLPGKYRYFLARDIQTWKESHSTIGSDGKCEAMTKWQGEADIVFLYNMYRDDYGYGYQYDDLKKLAATAAVCVLYDHYRKENT